MHKKLTTVLVAVAAAGGLAGVASAGGAVGTIPANAVASRLDDGASLIGQARITEQEAITAAQGAATGDLNEVDLEQYNGTLAFNVDVGSSDVKVDAGTGKVLDVSHDD